MQKNYRDYTVGELLDEGFKVKLYKHNLTKKEAEKELNKFEGIKNSSHYLEESDCRVYGGWKKGFSVDCFEA